MNPERALLALAAALTAACGSDSRLPTTPAPPVANVTSLVVSGWLSPLKPGDSVQLSATAIQASGGSRSVTTEASWTSSKATVAVVSQTGLVTALAGGDTEIRATFAAQTGRLALRVERTIDPGGPMPGLACGAARWSVKTLSDADAPRIDINSVRQTTIRALNERPLHCSGLPSARTFEEEFQVYEVVGRITFVRLEDDRDYHVTLADPADSSYTIVTEVADIACQGANRSPHRGALESARNAWISMLGARSPSAAVGMTVRVRGVGFYDFDHGQRGRSRNCIELHPILSIAPVH